MLEFYGLEICFCLLELAWMFGCTLEFTRTFARFPFPLICKPLISDV